MTETDIVEHMGPVEAATTPQRVKQKQAAIEKYGSSPVPVLCMLLGYRDIDITDRDARIEVLDATIEILTARVAELETELTEYKYAFDKTVEFHIDRVAVLEGALQEAKHHIEHMAAWIGKQNGGYSFEALGEDMPGIDAALTDTPDSSLQKVQTTQPVIKPLEWQAPSMNNNQCWVAETPFGSYSVVHEDGWHAHFEIDFRPDWHVGIDGYPTDDHLGKDAAQEHWESLISKCLAVDGQQ